jgi:hypothetical protein
VEVDVHRNHRFAAVTRAFVIVAVLVAFSGPFAGSARAADRKVVKLSIEIGVTGAPRIRVRRPYAKIWRNDPDKPNKVLWRMQNNRTSYYEIFWEFRYDPSKKEATADYFGEVDLECGETRVELPPVIKPDTPNAVWPYTITAYACAKGMKAQKIASVNARVIWND